MEYKNLNELLEAISPINASALGTICGIDKSQMRQYVSGFRNPSQQTIDKINEGLSNFAEKLKEVRIG